MLVTDKFVMLNLPKTGSTFSRQALRRIHFGGRLKQAAIRFGLHDAGMEELMMKQFYFTDLDAGANRVARQHGCYCQIPAQHREKTIFSCVRDPFRRLVSLYEYAAWKHQVFPSREIVTDRFAHFPDLSFEEFFDLECRIGPTYSQPEGVQVEIGPLTTQFIRFFARDPVKTILSLREDTDLKADYDTHFPAITFLHTENLNQELAAFLGDIGYTPRQLAFLQDARKTNVSGRSRQSYFTPGLVAELLQRERFFFQLFPEYLPQADSQGA